jgi:maltooligosyltrehalose trehalohydrolase
MRVGARLIHNEWEFVLWAPFRTKLEIKVVSPVEMVIPMEKDESGYWTAKISGLPGGAKYYYLIDGSMQRPDPASAFQPEGVHGPSQLIDHQSFQWHDRSWPGIPLEEMIMYELHIGAFTAEGTFEAVIPRLDALRELGINALSIMPVAQFPGERNWGYDGAYPYAVQNSYGGPEGLKKLVDACHSRGMAVIFDVVYNHLGPEGNYLGDYGPYFTDHYRTPWGMAVNYDRAYSDHVRNFFIENALYWFEFFHLDGLRLDAVHAIFDMSATPFLRELAERVGDYSREKGRKHYLIAESDLNDTRVIRPEELGGYGLDAQWCDDFHHCLHTLLTGEKNGYYTDFGKMRHMKKALQEGFVYSGQYSSFRMRKHGNSSQDRPANQFIVFSQNHDQTGNRMLGERLTALVPFEALKLAAAAVVFSPFIPLLFMGEEYGETSPFLYFVSHSDPELIRAVREGRSNEFREFSWRGKCPDPQSPETFTGSRLKWDDRNQGTHQTLLKFYKHLIRLRREMPALSRLSKNNLAVTNEREVLQMRRWHEDGEVLCLFNYHPAASRFSSARFIRDGWEKALESSGEEWNGPGGSLPERIADSGQLTIGPFGAALYTRVNRS